MKLLHLVRFREFRSFLLEFGFVNSQIRSVLLALVLLIGFGGWILSKTEGLSFWEGQYFAFITALTIGYGDLSPKEPLGRVACVLIGVVGMVWIGLVVGAAAVALRRTD